MRAQEEFINEARTPENFVDDMVNKGTGWIGILAVARCVRGGLWYNKVSMILIERNIMPADPAEKERQVAEHFKAVKQLEEAKETKRLDEKRLKRQARLDVVAAIGRIDSSKETEQCPSILSSLNPRPKPKPSAKSSKGTTKS